MKRSFAEIYKIAHKLTHNEKMQIKEHQETTNDLLD